MTQSTNDERSSDNAPTTPGGLPPEKVEDRPGVGVVTPADYPDATESDATGTGIQSPPGLDDDMDFERRIPSS